jgi:hypothetical protein
MDDAKPKKRKPLTPRQQLKNVMDALAEDAPTDKKPLTKRERLEAEKMREKLIKMAEDQEAEMDREAAKPGWGKRVKKKAPPGSGYVM